MFAALVAMLAGCALVVWHQLLVRLIQGQPSTVAWWLLAAFGLVLAGRTLARRRPEPARGRLERPWASLDAASLSLLAFLLLLVWLFDHGFERAASDGREYFVQVRSLVIDGDLDFANENAVFGVRGTADRYAIGAPLLWAPFFVAAHLWLGLANLFGADYVRDGFGNPYQRAIGLATLVYGAIGLALIMRVLADHYSRGLAAAATITMASGSFLIWYLTVDNSMVHGVSMFATTLFLFVWYRAGREPTWRGWIVLGAAAGLMALVRWQNLMFAVVPLVLMLVDALRAGRTRTAAGKTRPGALAGAAAFGAAAVMTFLPQLVFWKIVRGGWFDVPAAEHGMQAVPIHLADVLFSPNHGLLSWSPVIYLALLGLPGFVSRHPRLGLVLAGGFLAQLYVNGAVDVWWGGAGFGARRFDNSALVFAAGLVALLDWLRRRPLVAPAAALVVLIAANAMFMLDVKQGRASAAQAVTFDQMLHAVYRRIGNPFSFPLNAWTAWRYGGGPALYDRLRGRTYNNLTIDFGEIDDEPFLAEGWSGAERTPDWSFRWSEGPRSVLVVPLVEPDDYTMDLRCAPFTFPGAPLQAVELIFNRERIGSIVLPPGLSEGRLHVPRTAVRRNLNRIELRYAYSRSPREAGLGDDPRELAMLCDWIRLTRGGDR